MDHPRVIADNQEGALAGTMQPMDATDLAQRVQARSEKFLKYFNEADQIRTFIQETATKVSAATDRQETLRTIYNENRIHFNDSESAGNEWWRLKSVALAYFATEMGVELERGQQVNARGCRRKLVQFIPERFSARIMEEMKDDIRRITHVHNRDNIRGTLANAASRLCEVLLSDNGEDPKDAFLRLFMQEQISINSSHLTRENKVFGCVALGKCADALGITIGEEERGYIENCQRVLDIELLMAKQRKMDIQPKAAELQARTTDFNKDEMIKRLGNLPADDVAMAAEWMEASMQFISAGLKEFDPKVHSTLPYFESLVSDRLEYYKAAVEQHVKESTLTQHQGTAHSQALIDAGYLKSDDSDAADKRSAQYSQGALEVFESEMQRWNESVKKETLRVTTRATFSEAIEKGIECLNRNRAARLGEEVLRPGTIDRLILTMHALDQGFQERYDAGRYLAHFVGDREYLKSSGRGRQILNDSIAYVSVLLDAPCPEKVLTQLRATYNGPPG